jgi:hypothetical protein
VSAAKAAFLRQHWCLDQWDAGFVWDEAYAAGRAAAVADLQPAYSAMQERAEKAEAALARIFDSFDEGTAKVVQGLRRARGASPLDKAP